ncbi:MAG: branched-chain amino acid ABC transporter permease [Pseudomonadota bacterium]|nr:branched-chain amino acid ABC transporter permease [Pseudomonadota bacterium]
MNPNHRSRVLLTLASAIAVCATIPLYGSDYITGVALTLLMWIALTQSWVVLSAMTGYISLGHAVFFGAGAYVMVLTFGVLPFWISVLTAGAATGVLALLVGYPCLRVRGPYFVILTFGLAELVKYIVINVEAALGKFGRLLMGAPSLDQLFYVILVLAVSSMIITYTVRRSRFGAGLRAIRENEEAAETVGINVARFKVLAFALSAIIPGMVGSVVVLRTTYFEPLDVFNPITSFTIVSMAIIGGGDDVPGPVYGACFLVLLQELLWANWPEIYMILLGAFLVGFVLRAPDGIQGWLTAFQRRKAR